MGKTRPSGMKEGSEYVVLATDSAIELSLRAMICPLPSTSSTTESNEPEV